MNFSKNKKDKYIFFDTGFPSCSKEDIDKVKSTILRSNLFYIKSKVSNKKIQYKVNGKYLTFPDRIYFNDIKETKLQKLTEQQRNIIHCIYSRHCDGFIREKHLKELLSSNYEDWTIPYIVKICDEYVVEILEMTYKLLIGKDLTKIQQFCRENKVQFLKSYHRMISYWNEYYRWDCYRYRDYIGRKLFIECFGYTRSMELKRASSKTINFSDYILDVDYINTKSYYDNRHSISEECSCDGCKNFVLAISSMSKDVKSIFYKLGVDISKPSEIYVIYSSKDDILHYSGWYDISGKIKEEAYMLSEDKRYNVMKMIEVNENFSFGFNKDTTLFYDDFPTPCFKMEVAINLKWILENPNTYL